jgi:lysophospholipase L1-like esterase
MTISTRKVMFCGDSEVYGYINGVSEGTGGPRPRFFAYLRSLGHAAAAVGPYDNTGLHRGVAGQRATQVAADLPAFATQLTTYAPDYVVCNWSVNDIGNGVSAADTLVAVAAIVNQIITTRPTAEIFWGTCVVPGGAAAGGYGTNTAVFNTFNTDLAGVVEPLGVTVINYGTPTLGSDSIHLSDVITGYPAVGLAGGVAVSAVW